MGKILEAMHNFVISQTFLRRQKTKVAVRGTCAAVIRHRTECSDFYSTAQPYDAGRLMPFQKIYSIKCSEAKILP